MYWGLLKFLPIGSCKHLPIPAGLRTNQSVIPPLLWWIIGFIRLTYRAVGEGFGEHEKINTQHSWSPQIPHLICVDGVPSPHPSPPIDSQKYLKCLQDLFCVACCKWVNNNPKQCVTFKPKEWSSLNKGGIPVYILQFLGVEDICGGAGLTWCMQITFNVKSYSISKLESQIQFGSRPFFTYGEV